MLHDGLLSILLDEWKVKESMWNKVLLKVVLLCPDRLDKVIDYLVSIQLFMIFNHRNTIIIKKMDTRTRMLWQTIVIGERMCCPIDECDIVSILKSRVLLLMWWCYWLSSMRVIMKDCWNVVLPWYIEIMMDTWNS